MKTWKDQCAEYEKMAQEWFGNHEVVSLQRIGTLESKVEGRLVWREPGTNINSIEYRLINNYLLVFGDLGEAIYWWSSPHSFEWIAGLNLDYFRGKCQASEVGKDFKEWNEKQALEKAREYLEEHIKEVFYEKYDEADEKFKELVTKRVEEAWKDFCDDGGDHSISYPQEWVEWCNDDSERTQKYFGEDYWEFIYGIGETTHIRCVAHLYGLKMAMEQIQK